MEQVQKTTLPNGVRILSENLDHVGSAAVGVWCLTGSVHEEPSEAGITHFIEHMLFKGTAKRTSQQIAEEIEGRGGGLNAFTDKERTCYYCRVLADDVPVGIDVLTDMVVGSLLDPDELRREQGVVIEEIKRSEDEPSDHVHDLHIQNLWNGHPLGLPVIGTKESVASFDPQALRAYLARRYTGGNIIVAATGKVDHQAIVDLTSSAFSSLPSSAGGPQFPPTVSVPGVSENKKDVEQVHFCIGTHGRAHRDPDFFTLVVLDAVLGGGMSSRLFQEVREKRGLAYAIGSYALSYSCGGAFTVYGGTGRQSWEEVQEVVSAELAKLASDGPTEEEVAKVQRQIAGNMVIGLESTSTRMNRIAKNEIVYGRQVSVEETVGKINAVTSHDVRELASEMFDPAKIRTTAIVPE